MSFAPLKVPSVAKEDAEQVASAQERVPQRLKPDCKSGVYGTAEAVPLSKTSFSAASEAGLQKAAFYGTDNSLSKTRVFSRVSIRALEQNEALPQPV
jgi:hypothetical protein